MRGTTINVGVRMVVEDCITCGVHFAMPDDLRDRRMEDHRNFYCPNGHQMCFTGKNTEARLAEAERSLQRERNRVQATRDLLHAEERSHAATRGHVTRKRKELERAKAGVCPVEGCHRHFQNLGRHMQSKHPDFKP